MEFFFVDTPANSDKENSINFILYESRNIYNLFKNLSSALFHLQFNHVPFCIKIKFITNRYATSILGFVKKVI